jgi:hypothetical protein
MELGLTQWVGYAATVLFALSYACRRPAWLLAVQALASTLWVAYGVLLAELPLILSSVVTAAAAAWSWRRLA